MISREMTTSVDRVLGGTVDRLKEKLSLKEDQVKKLQEIYDKTKEGLDEINREGRWQEMREFRESARKSVREMLDEDQNKQYETLTRSSNPMGGFGGNFGFGDISTDELKRRLGLSDEQVEKISRIREDSREKTAKMWEGMRDGGNWQGAMQDWSALRSETNENIKAELNDDQKKKYDELLNDRSAGRISPGQRAERLVKEMLVEQARVESVTSGLTRVIELQRDLDARVDTLNRELREMIRKEISEEEVSKKLAAYREERKKLENAVDEAESKLRELLTKSQEARLVSEGLLR